MRWPRLQAMMLAVCVAAMGCGPKQAPAPALAPPPTAPAPAQLFERITASSGVQFVHRAGTNYSMLDQVASGVALLDFNQDGILDLYLVQNADTNAPSGNKLYQGLGSGKFRDVSAASGVDVKGQGMGAIAGDINNDGWPDLVVTEYGATRVFQNQAGQRFVEITAACGVDNPRWAVAASFIDFDRDGWLDLVVGNYVDYDPSQACARTHGQADFCSPDSFPPTVSRLWRNVSKTAGAEPKFEDWTVRSGVAKSPGMALGVVCADFTGDRWPDIFFADDGRANRLFVNQRNGAFTEEAAVRGLAYDAMGRTAANMGVAWADLNNDGLGDLFITHLTDEFHSLFRQEKGGLYSDVIAQSGMQQQAWRATGFGTVAADFDLDGWPDLALASGLVRRSSAAQTPVAPGVQPWWRDYAQRNQLFLNADGRLRDVSGANPAFCGEASTGRSLAVGDLDNDGAPDLVFGPGEGPVELYRNTVSRPGHWLKVRLIEPALGGRDAIGAEIRLIAAARSWQATLQPATSYLASHDPTLHFGLGPAAKIDRAEVVWPNGDEEHFNIGEANRQISLKKGEGQKAEVRK
jgi:hypothetical protein